MEKPNASQPGRFLKDQVAPILLIFLIPVFSVIFFNYAEKRLDGEVLASIRRDLANDKSIDEERRRSILDFFERMPVSKLMASDDPEIAAMQADFQPVASRYATFRWMQRIGWICLAMIGLTFLVVGGSVWYSLRSQAALYQALRIGWPMLKISAVVQVIGQGVLACALSFWVTAIFANLYSPKLVIVIVLLALCGVGALLVAIFRKVGNRFEVEGVLLPEEDGKLLWERVWQMADALQTPCPDHIILGGDANFFVTEHPVILRGEILQGRTLFISLPLLKILSYDEAEAVLGHELAHFSGDDTLWAKRISPLTGKFRLYLEVLSNGLSLVVAHFMHFFWKLYGLSINRLSRIREFRADEIGAALSSKDALKRALIKISAYCEYRAQTERELFRKNRVDRDPQLARRLEEGFSQYLMAFVGSSRALGAAVGHPFDSHPTLKSRLAHLGFEAKDITGDPNIRVLDAPSWYGNIPTAPTLLEEMWSHREKHIQTAHEQDLAWRLLPANEEEAAIVAQRFPKLTFYKNKEPNPAAIDHACLHMPGWKDAIFFQDIEKVELDRVGWPANRLTIAHRVPGTGRRIETKCYPAPFKNDHGTTLLQAFEVYYTRHQTARARVTAGN